LGDSAVLDQGLNITTGLDLEKQQAAQKSVQEGLRELDKRQGYRGAEKNLQDSQEIAEFLLETRDHLIDEYIPMRTLTAEGKAIPEKEPLNLNPKAGPNNLPEYIRPGALVKGIVTKVDDTWGL